MSPCGRSSNCRNPNAVCVNGACVPRCADSDGGVVASTAEILAQRASPGQTVAYEFQSVTGGGAAWKAISMVDGCKTSSILLEYYCSAEPQASKPAPTLAYHYIACSPGENCQGVIDPASGITAAACVPIPAGSCEDPAWHTLGSLLHPIDIFTLSAAPGALCAGGLGGVHCLNAGSPAWTEHNDGLPPPGWLNLPLITNLTHYNGEQYALYLNAPDMALYHRDTTTTAWSPVDDTSINAQQLFSTSQSLYLGDPYGVFTLQPTTGAWAQLGSDIGDVTALYQDGTTFFSGTDTGDVLWFDMLGNQWRPATEPFEGTVTVIQNYSAYLYVGLTVGLHRCWSEAPIWGIEVYCEPIEPETGLSNLVKPNAMHVDNGILYLASTHGVHRFDAMNDQWIALTNGLMNPQTLEPWDVRALATWHNTVVAGTSGGVLQLGCE